jgi:hypothetical protein
MTNSRQQMAEVNLPESHPPPRISPAAVPASERRWDNCTDQIHGSSRRQAQNASTSACLAWVAQTSCTRPRTTRTTSQLVESRVMPLC